VNEPREPDIDARFLLANERTVLAWTRTALTLVAGGVGIDQFGDVTGKTALAALLLVCGAGAAIVGAFRYQAADRAIRRGDLPPRGQAPVIVAVGVAFVAAVLLVAILASP
jgi:putative membrane protein